MPFTDSCEDQFIREENTIALSAVTLAGAYLCHSCYKCWHTSADMALNSKQQTLHTQSITELILDPDSNSDFLTMTNLAVMCMTTWRDAKEQPVSSNQREYISGQKFRQMEGRPKTKRMTRLLPHTSPGTSAWRKQTSAMNPRIPQFTGDKTGDTHITS